MECSEKLVWNNYTREELKQIRIQKPDEQIREKIKKNWDCVAKPIDGLGRLEELTGQIGAIHGSEEIEISKKAVIIMCADNGIVEEGVSQSGQEVTVAVAKNMLKKQSSVGKMASMIGADIFPVDIGINGNEKLDGIVERKIRRGTRNFRVEPAMTEKEAIQAISVGIEMVLMCKKAGYRILGTGEMGIGNTTTSSAVVAALLKCDVGMVTGRGAGLDDSGLARKRQVIAEAVDRYQLLYADALTILQTVGGLDIAGLVGVCIGGALYHIPIVLDGVISMVAALVAECMVSGTREYLLPSHRGKEPAVSLLARELRLEPIIDGNLALGEGTGAVMLFPLLDMALSVYESRTTFEDIQIEAYQRY